MLLVTFLDNLNPWGDRNFTNTTHKILVYLLLLLLLCLLNTISFKLVNVLIQSKLIGVSYSSKNIHSISTNTIVFVGLLSPITEELMFRLGLLFSPSKATSLIIGILFTIVSLTIGRLFLYNTLYLKVYLFLLLALYIIILYLIKHFNNKLMEFWKVNKRAIFFLSIISFAFSHINKYVFTNQYELFLYWPILFLPFFISGYFLSLIRIKICFTMAIFSHSIINFILILLETQQFI